MKKFLAIAVLLTAFAASESFAQATAVVNLTVNNAISLTKTRDISFGIVPQGVTTVTINPVTGAGATGTFTLGASASTQMNVSWSSTDLASGGNTIGFAGAGTASGNTVNVQGTSLPLTNPGIFTTSGTGAYFFWAGGTATLTPTQATGSYTGTYTLTVTY
ncbi:MAG TPA: DUF4402 domain-containing protein [Candidatus Acidoferrales bacterium]|nr:DUF4402 domain-containing protein [Candidatus Acidoferrales bacterium]